jgi:hypothetical protein
VGHNHGYSLEVHDWLGLAANISSLLQSHTPLKGHEHYACSFFIVLMGRKDDVK